ncbi:hypothetical protein [Aeromicrobium yanjiei]|uniref:DUF5655 domain-containing protein n=1 Tax=Aeromicrobium yanjiei TaxID=2662028 RepID=A0A5Q2MDG7_9ACTN|nr:hypothetical protein [Aeromicrobium yanjiei]QGG39903.1 hypothetical protein GEV26_00095 [Aeromicrobium yanjiei]
MRLPSEVLDYLADAATQTGRSPEDIIAGLFHMRVTDRAELRAYFGETTQTFTEMLEALDRTVRIRNPGVQYTYRNAYLGYRRETESAPRIGERSQVFLSVMRTKSKFVLALPLNPSDFGDFPGVRSVQGKGRHGIGDLQVHLSSLAHLHGFVERFEPWLSQSAGAVRPIKKHP